jgi:hypothetical protein
MFILYSILLFSLLMLFAMVGFRIWELNKGKIPFPDKGETLKRFHVFEEWEKKAWETSRRFSMHFLSLFLRIVIIGIDKIRKWMRYSVSRIEETLVKKNADKELQGAPSFFLKDIAEHKKKIRARFKKSDM